QVGVELGGGALGRGNDARGIALHIPDQEIQLCQRDSQGVTHVRVTGRLSANVTPGPPWPLLFHESASPAPRRRTGLLGYPGAACRRARFGGGRLLLPRGGPLPGPA